MDAMLIGSVKEDRRAELGVSLGVDISKLDVCFGGFSPTVMGDMNLTWERAVEAEARIRERKEAALKAAQLDAARESELRDWTDSAGTTWEFVLLDGADVRIKGCKPTGPQVVVPSVIQGHTVVELASNACSCLEEVTEILVSDSVVSIGSCAFRGDTNLRYVKLPAYVAEFDPDWFRYCKLLECLELPGALEVLTSRIFDHGALKELVIGEGTKDVRPGTFVQSKLESIRVNDSNPFMATDGYALYSKDKSVMAALAVPVASYAVDEACKVLGKKAFSSFAPVQDVTLPASLEVIGEFAFASTSIRSFGAPSRLRAILEKAFYGCRQLESVTLNEGLELIGPSAFADTQISALRLPDTVTDIGAHVADGTNVVFSGEDATFAIEGARGSLFLDGQGGLYRKGHDGLTFVRMLDPAVIEYTMLAGTTSIAKQAFESAHRLQRVTLPTGLQKIGGAAFRGCTELTAVNIPDGIEWIGGDAFLDTALESIHLPASLEHLGPRALVTQGAHHGRMAPSLREIHLDQGSQRFRFHEGLLLERKDDGAERVVIYVGPNKVVHVPDSVDEICGYAFNGSLSIEELFLSDRIATVGVRGLAVDAPLERIHVDLAEPYEGHESFDIRPPHTDRSEQQMMLALTVPSFVNVEAMFEHYDNSIINASSFDAMSESGLGEYERAVRLIERLEDPVYMSSVSQAMAYRILRDDVRTIALEMARHDDRDALRRLADLSVLNGENIDEVIASVQQTQDASMTGYLLELKRERFGKRSFDFSL